MTDQFDVVDLGTKHGNAIAEFLKKGNMYLGNDQLFKSFRKDRCVGYERPEAENYRSIVEKKKFRFRVADLATDEAIAAMPAAHVYLAFHFLEHVPNKSWANKLVKASLTNAKSLAWFRLPSFEQDKDTGEGVLREHGMRFCWTHWTGHPTHWLVQDCVEAIEEWAKDNPEREYTLKVKPAELYKNIGNPRIVPISAPIDTNEYSESLGPKPKLPNFKPPVVSAWEVIVNFSN